MISKTISRGLLGMLLGCLVLAVATLNVRAADAGPAPAPSPKEKKEPTIAEKMAGAQNPQKDSEERELLIKGLQAVTPEQERDYKVVEGMLDIAARADDDPSVRVAAINALGAIETNVTRDHKAKNKYIQPFATILKTGPTGSSPGEPGPVRKEVAHVFRSTLDPSGLQDKDVGFRALVEIARNKNEPNQGLRDECILAVGEFGDVEGLQIIIDILNEQDTYTREKAAEALSALIQKAVAADKVNIATIRKLIELLNDQKTSIDLKINVMDALAQLIQGGNGSAAREGLQPIKDIVAKAQETKLVMGGIHALGVIGTAEAVDPLRKAYGDYYDDKNPSKDYDVRVAVVRAVRNVLTVQRRAKNFDSKAAADGAALLIHVTDEEQNTDVVNSAIYAMRSLFDKKFDAQRKDAVESLLYTMRAKKTSDDMKKKIAETLEFLTNMDFGTDVAKWGKYFDEKFGAGKRQAPKSEAAPPPAPKEAPKEAAKTNDAPKAK